jgi:hypothetical protein
MKQVLISIAGAAIGSLIFIALIFAVVYGYSAYSDHGRAIPTDPALTSNPAGLKIIRHSPVDDVDKFTVMGVLENAGPSSWYAPRIVISISASGKKIGECETTVYGKVDSKTRHPFLISCDETSSRLPFPASYRIEVRDARRAER